MQGIFISPSRISFFFFVFLASPHPGGSLFERAEIDESRTVDVAARLTKGNKCISRQLLHTDKQREECCLQHLSSSPLPRLSTEFYQEFYQVST